MSAADNHEGTSLPAARPAGTIETANEIILKKQMRLIMTSLVCDVQ